MCAPYHWDPASFSVVEMGEGSGLYSGWETTWKPSPPPVKYKPEAPPTILPFRLYGLDKQQGGLSQCPQAPQQLSPAQKKKA